MKAIIFDIDNTLLDNDLAVKIACEILYHKYSEYLKKDFDSFLKDWFVAIEKYFPQFLRGEISFKEQRIKRVTELFSGTNLNIKKDAIDIFEEYLIAYENNWTLFEETNSVLEKLSSNYKLGIISNGEQVQQLRKLEVTGIKKYFSEIVISGEIGIGKPDKRIFDFMISKFEYSPSDCFYIGDKIKTDIYGSINSGMNGIWINRTGMKTDSNVEEIKSLNELENLIDKLKI